MSLDCVRIFLPTGRMPRITLIAAIARNGVIGKANALPWRLSGDLRRFRLLTLGHPVIMGRKTYASIGRPLPGRQNLVVSRDPSREIEGVTVVESLDEALAAAGDASDVFVIGGGEIYRLALPRAHRLEITEVQTDVAGDTWFPVLDLTAFREVRRERHRDDPSGLAYDFVRYERIEADA